MQSKSKLISSEKAMPPIEPPVVAIPVANPQCSENQWPSTSIDGVKSREVSTPQRIPKVRKKPK